MDDKKTNADQPAGCGWLLLVFCASMAVFVVWFILNMSFVRNVREWKRLWHSKFPTWQDWHDASEPARLATWKIGSVMAFLDGIAGLLVFGGIILILCRKNSTCMRAARNTGTWLLATFPAVLLVVGAVVGGLEIWSKIDGSTDGTNPETALYRNLATHAVVWSVALFLASPFTWGRWEWRRALFAFAICLSMAVILGTWGLRTLLHALDVMLG